MSRTSNYSLVGDIILDARKWGPDLPPTLGYPSGLVVSAINDVTSSLPAGTYSVQATQFNNWGESTPTPVQTQIIGAGQKLSMSGTLGFPAWAALTAYVVGQIVVPTTANGHAYQCIVAGTSAGVEPTWPLTSGGTVVDGTATWMEYGPGQPAGVIKYRMYYGITTITAYVESTTLPIQVRDAGSSGTPPTRSTAFNPDADGQFVSAATMFQWLVQGLRRAMRILGGIRDITGMQAQYGLPNYTLVGEWIKLTNGWFDGYPLLAKGRRWNWQRTQIAAISGSFDLVSGSNVQVISVDPQPDRTGSNTTLAAPMTAQATSATVVDASGFELPFGMVSFGSEICFFNALNGNVFSGLTRGCGGTLPTAHIIGEAVLECNLQFDGLRVSTQQYTPGDSSLIFTYPMGWAEMLSQFVLAQYREAEQEYEEAAAKRAEFDASITAWGRSNRSIGAVQIGDFWGPDSTPGGLGGGWLIP